MSTAVETIQPSITFLNMSGDVTLTWDASSEDTMLELIRSKMAQGYSFFILEPRKLGFFPLPSRKVPVTSIEQVKMAGKVSMRDAEVNRVIKNARVDDPEVEQVLSSGKATLAPVQGDSQLQTVARARTAEQAVRNQTVATRPIAGG